MVVILGAGITGLYLGWELHKRGIEFLILESEARVGGVIRSETIEGRVVEWGPQRLRLTSRVDRLVRDLGLESQLVRVPPDLELFVYRAGALHPLPLSLRSLFRSGTMSWGARLRLLCEPLTRGPRPAESVAQYFRRKLGGELYENVAGPLYAGLYGSNLEEMDVERSLGPVLRELGVGRSLLLRLVRTRVAARPAPVSFEGGMQTLPNALADELRDSLRLGTTACRIGRAGAKWRVDHDGGTVVASDVVLTVPAPVAAALLGDEAPEPASALRRLRYNSIAVAQLLADTDLRGMGFQVGLGQRHLRLRGVTFCESLFGRRDLYTAYLAGSDRPASTPSGDEEIGHVAVHEFEQCTGYNARVLSVGRASFPAWDRSWRVLDSVVLSRGIHVAANWWSRPGILGRLREAAELAERLGSN